MSGEVPSADAVHRGYQSQCVCVCLGREWASASIESLSVENKQAEQHESELETAEEKP